MLLSDLWPRLASFKIWLFVECRFSILLTMTAKINSLCSFLQGLEYMFFVYSLHPCKNGPKQWRRVQCRMRKSSLSSKPLMTVKKLHFHLGPRKIQKRIYFYASPKSFPVLHTRLIAQQQKKTPFFSLLLIWCVSTSVESMELCSQVSGYCALVDSICVSFYSFAPRFAPINQQRIRFTPFCSWQLSDERDGTFERCDSNEISFGWCSLKLTMRDGWKTFSDAVRVVKPLKYFCNWDLTLVNRKKRLFHYHRVLCVPVANDIRNCFVHKATQSQMSWSKTV